MAHDTLAAGSADVIVAGGMESMTNAPYLLKKHRSGARIGHDTVYDHMFLDGLEDAYEQGPRDGHLRRGHRATNISSRASSMDDYAIESLRRAKEAIDQRRVRQGNRRRSPSSTRKGEVTVDVDEQPGKGNPDKIPQLKPAFAKDGTITAATARRSATAPRRWC